MKNNYVIEKRRARRFAITHKVTCENASDFYPVESTTISKTIFFNLIYKHIKSGTNEQFEQQLSLFDNFTFV